MPGICLYSQPGVGPPDNPVQDTHAFIVVPSTSQASSHLHIEFALDTVLEVVEILVTTQHCEIVTVDDDLEVARLVGEAAW